MSILRIQTPRAFRPLLEAAPYKGAFGGRGSGKSYFFADCAIERLIDGGRVVCIREVQNSIKDSVRQLLIDRIKFYDLSEQFDITRDEIRTLAGGLAVFRGMNETNKENIKSLEGFDVAWVEEAHMLSQGSLDLLRPTIRKPGSEIWFSWNPTNSTDPVDKFLRGENKPSGAIVVQVNYNDNPFFPEKLMAEINEDRTRDPKKAAHTWDGAYAEAPEGSYYGLEIAKAEAERRICDVIPDPVLPVHTCWDLGKAGNMCTWFFQLHAGQWRFVDYHEYEKPGLPHAAEVLDKKKAERKWRYGTHIWPHDGKATDLSSGELRKDTMAKLGYPVEVLKIDAVADGIEATRRVIEMAYFDKTRCAKGIDRLKNYKRKFDKSRQQFLEDPEKDGNDHGADALRTGAMGQGRISNNANWSNKVMNFEAVGVA